MSNDSSDSKFGIGFIILCFVGLFAYASLNDCSTRKKWKDAHADIAARVGLKTSNLLAPYAGQTNTYEFRGRENNSSGDAYPPSGVLYNDRRGPLKLYWNFNEHVFWNSEPTVHVESPSSATATIEEKSGPPPSRLQKGRISHPRIAIRIKSDNPEPHIVYLRLENMHVAIAEMKSSSFEYRKGSIDSASLRVLVSSAPTPPSLMPESQKSPDDVALAPQVYIDPKGFFKIAPPQGWRIQEYPQDLRGKVAFIARGNQIDLRVLAKTVEIPDYDGLIKNLKDVEKQVGVSTNIEPYVFNGMPAVKRVATVTMQGVTQKLLWIDLLINDVSHNLQYGSLPNLFDKHYETAWQSMLTYEPLKQEKSASPEEARKHEAAKWIRLARLALEMSKTQTAKDAVSAGLEADPENAELKQLRTELDKR